MSRFTKQASRALEYGAAAAGKQKMSYVGTEHLLLGLVLEEEGTAGRVLADNGVDRDKLLETMEKYSISGETRGRSRLPYSTGAEKMLADAAEECRMYGEEEIGTEHILLAIIKETDCMASRLLFTLQVDFPKVYTEIRLAMGADQGLIREEMEAMNSGGSQVVSQHPTLDQYSRDLTALAEEGRLDPIFGRSKEMERMIRILSRRTKNNPCLIGEPGVGKSAIVEGLAQRIAEGNVPEVMKQKRILVLDLSAMVAGSKYRGEFEERIKGVIKEAAMDRNLLLFIDEIHTMIGAGGAEGAMDASNILKPALSRGEIQLIGATTISEYRKHIEKDAALERRFQPVEVEEPGRDQSLLILQGLRGLYEKHHGVKIEDEALEKAVDLSIRYINDRYLPDKALDLIDEASSKIQLRDFSFQGKLQEEELKLRCLKAEKETAIQEGDLEKARELGQEQKRLEKRLEKRKEQRERVFASGKGAVTGETVAEIVAGWTKIPVDKLQEEESKRLSRLEKTLHERVIGQEEAVSAVAKAIKRGRVGLKDPKRPIGSFLFLGPTGVGKTELSKALAAAVFGSEKSLIRVDMSEYMEKHSVAKLIGSPPGYVGYDEGGQLSERVRRNPYSVLLFDEIEKAHPDVFNILLQVLDDGHITDSQGRKIDFKSTVIIMTSNAGAQSILEPKKLGFVSNYDKKKDYEDMKGMVMEEVRRIFRPEFLNRIDDIIVFHSLQKEETKEIAGLLLKELQKRCYEQMRINLKLRPSVKEFVAEKGYDAKYGARPLKRLIQDKIEDQMAEEILAGKIKAGDRVTIAIQKKDIKFLVNV